jgi:hypothetical protein
MERNAEQGSGSLSLRDMSLQCWYTVFKATFRSVVGIVGRKKQVENKARSLRNNHHAETHPSTGTRSPSFLRIGQPRRVEKEKSVRIIRKHPR